MKKTDIEQGVKEVIALNSRSTSDNIQLSDKLDKYISSSMSDTLARKLKGKFAQINTTDLTNSLYSSVKKVNQLIDKIYGYYHSE